AWSGAGCGQPPCSPRSGRARSGERAAVAPALGTPRGGVTGWLVWAGAWCPHKPPRHSRVTWVDLVSLNPGGAYLLRQRHQLREQMFAPAVVEAVRRGRPEGLRALCEELHPGIYSFDMLRAEFCEELLEELAEFEEWCDHHELPLVRPNTMNNYGAVLDTFGF